MSEGRFEEWGLEPAPALESLESGNMRYEFMTWLGSGVLGPKLKGFIAGQDGEVLDTSGDQVRLRLGRKSWLPWSRRRKTCPIELTITVNRQTPCAWGMTHVVADMHPLVKKPLPEIVKKRCSKVARDLRSSFFGQDVQLVTSHTQGRGVRPFFASVSSR